VPAEHYDQSPRLWGLLALMHLFLVEERGHPRHGASYSGVGRLSNISTWSHVVLSGRRVRIMRFHRGSEEIVSADS